MLKTNRGHYSKERIIPFCGGINKRQWYHSHVNAFVLKVTSMIGYDVISFNLFYRNLMRFPQKERIIWS